METTVKITRVQIQISRFRIALNIFKKIKEMKREIRPEVKAVAAKLYAAYGANNAPIWRRIGEEILKPRRKQRIVNLSRINRHTSEGDTIIVPGKVLAAGELKHKITLAAFSISKQAEAKIKKIGGQIIDLNELIQINPRGSGVKIIG